MGATFKMDGNYYEEKRDFVRMKVDTQIMFSMKGDQNIYYGKSINLSATGLYMTTNHELSVGSHIELVMNPNGDSLPPFITEGEVLRCEVDTDDDTLFHISVILITH
jgi:hypothetical protein